MYANGMSLRAHMYAPHAAISCYTLSCTLQLPPDADCARSGPEHKFCLVSRAWPKAQPSKTVFKLTEFMYRYVCVCLSLSLSISLSLSLYIYIYIYIYICIYIYI